MTPVAPRIVNDVSYVTRMNHENDFSWQAQFLVTLGNDTCCSAHCNYSVSYVTRMNHESDFSWQAYYLMRLDNDTCCSAHCKWHFM